MKLEIKKIGNSSGILLPKELMAELDLKQGDWLSIVREPDGRLMIVPRDNDLEEGLDIARKLMRRYDNALKELAK
jgi:putative addiction module antidote